ncbi:hypothetical protein QFZ67_004859 [Streptomyces sp. V1I1]|nr:hypothetical protein [Streptomyces sp. V1I1]
MTVRNESPTQTHHPADHMRLLLARQFAGVAS